MTLFAIASHDAAQAAPVAPGLSSEFLNLMSGSSFRLMVPRDERMEPIYKDLTKLLDPYKGKKLSPEELGKVASQTEHALRQMGYRGVGIRIEKSYDGKPLSLIATYDYGNTTVKPATRQEIVKQLQEAVAKEQGKSAAADGKSQLDERLSSMAGTLQSGASAEDKREWLLSTAQGYVEGQVNSALNSGLGELATGVNSQVNITFDREDGHMKLGGKILVPIINEHQYTIFTQAGLTEGNNDRTIGHVGVGARFFPDAVDFENVGTWMWGVNSVYDYDLDRYHKRYSIGGEFAYDTLSLYGNVYQRISDWRRSPDFDSGIVEERPANGWDIGAKYALPMYLPLAFTGSYTQWRGNKVSPWGDTDDLMADPHIWSVGLEWSPVPALSLSATQEIAEGGDTNTEFMINFNIPLGEGLNNAFEPDYGGWQNTIAGMRNQFINRNYDMPLEYRSEPGKYLISQCGLDAANNSYCFHVQDGFEDPAAGVSVDVIPDDKCVIMSNGGNYTTDGNGNIYASVDSSCTNHTIVDVGAGDSHKEFLIDIGNAAISYAIDPPVMKIRSDESGTFTLYGGPDAEGINVEWSVTEGEGDLKDIEKVTDADGLATVTYVPDPDTVYDYKATVTATVAGKDFPAYVEVTAAALTISAPPSVDGDSYQITISGGTPDGEFTADLEGSGEIVVPDTGLKFDSNGDATVTVQVQSPAEGTISVTVTDTESGKQGTADTVLELTQYAPKFDSVSPSYQNDGTTVPGNEPFAVELSGLMPNTTIIYKAVNGVKPAEGNEATATVSGEGKATLKYDAITDITITKFVPDVEYAADKADLTDDDKLTKWQDAPEITVHQYALTVDAPATTENGKYTVTITGGKPGSDVKFDIQGNGTLDKQQGTFDQDGKIEVEVTVTQPATGDVTVTATSNGHSASDTTQLQLVDYTQSAGIDYPSFTPVGGSLQDKTVDFNKEFTVKAKGLLPDSTIIVTSDGKGVPQGGSATLKVNADGTCDIPYQAISDKSIKDFTVVYSYAVNEADNNDGEPFEGSFTSDLINVWQYNLTITAPDKADDGGDFVIDVDGGQPGGEITGEVGDGQGTITCDEKFDANGHAQCTINPDDSYDGKIDITVEGPNGEPGHAQTDTGLADYSQTAEIHLPSFVPAGSSEQPNTIDFNEPYTVKVTGLVPNSDVIVVPNGAAVAASGQSTAKVNENGEATLYMQAVSDQSVKSLNIKIKYPKTKAEAAQGEQSYTGDKTSGELKVWQYDLTVQAPTELTGDETSYEVVISGGKAGNPVTWEISGDADYSAKDAVFNADGSATATVTVKAPGTNAVTVSASDAETGYDVEAVTQLHLTAYTAAIETPSLTVGGQTYPNTVDFNAPFEIKVSGLKPGSEITVKADSGVTPAGGDNVTLKVGTDGSVTIPYAPVSDPAITQFDVVFDYVKNASGQTESFSQSVNIMDYNLKVESPTNADDGNPYDITVSGGKPGDQFTIDVDHGSVSCKLPSKTRAAKSYDFDGNGEASCTVTPEYGYDGQITVTVNGSGDEDSSSTSTNLSTYSPRIELPSYNGQAGTVDYGENFDVVITNLLPNSKVSLSSINGATVVNSTVTANADGKAIFNFNEITDNTVRSVSFDVLYFATKADDKAQKTTTLSGQSVAVHQYDPRFAADSATNLDGDVPVTLVLEGGKQGETVKWEVSGDAKVSPASSVFDSNGEAKVVVTGIGNFENEVTVTGKTMGFTESHTLTFINYNAQIVNLPQFTDPAGTLHKGTVDVGEPFTIYVEGVKPQTKVHFESTLTTPQGNDVLVGEDGKAKITFNPVTDLTAGEITVSATYNKNATQRETLEAKLFVHQYELGINVGDGKIDAYSDPANQTLDEQVVTIEGGKPNKQAVVDISGSGNLKGQGGTSQTVTFNSQGKADVTVVAAPDFDSDITINVKPADSSFTDSSATAQLPYSFDSWTTTPDFDDSSLGDPSLGSRTVDVETEYTFRITGVYPHSEVKWSTDSASAKLKSDTSTADASGVATVVLTAITDYDLQGFKLSATAHANPRETKDVSADITVKDYTLTVSSNKPTLDAWTAEGEGNYDSMVVTVTGGKSGSQLVWTVTGDGQLDTAGTRTKTATFGSDGSANITVYSKEPFMAAVNVKAEGLGSSDTLDADIAYSLTSYAPAFSELPSFNGEPKTTDYGKTFTVKMANAMPRSRVAWKTIGAAKPQSATTTVGADGTTTVTYAAVDDFDVTSLSIAATASVTATKTTDKTDTVKLAAYALSFDLGDGKLDAYNATGGADSQAVKVKGGKEGMQVDVVLTGDATFADGTTAKKVTLGADGTADLTVLSKAPYTANAVLSAVGPGNRTANGTVAYDLTQAAPTVNFPDTNGPNGNQTDTVDYEVDYSVTVSGLLPGTKVKPENYNGSSLKSTAEITVPANGTITLQYNKITDYNLDKVGVKFTYVKAGTQTAVYQHDYNVYDYKLTMTTSKSSIVGDETFTATVSGGKANAEVTFTVSGNGKITDNNSKSYTTKFNSSGSATITVQGVTPFTGTIKLLSLGLAQSVSTTWQASQKQQGQQNFGEGCSLGNAKTFWLPELNKVAKVEMTYGGRPGAYWELNSTPIETGCIQDGFGCKLTWNGTDSTIFKAGTNEVYFRGGGDTCSEGYTIYWLKAFDKIQ